MSSSHSHPEAALRSPAYADSMWLACHHRRYNSTIPQLRLSRQDLQHPHVHRTDGHRRHPEPRSAHGRMRNAPTGVRSTRTVHPTGTSPQQPQPSPIGTSGTLHASALPPKPLRAALVLPISRSPPATAPPACGVHFCPLCDPGSSPRSCAHIVAPGPCVGRRRVYELASTARWRPPVVAIRVIVITAPVVAISTR